MTTGSKSAQVGSEIPSVTKKSYQRSLDETAFAADSIHDNEYTRTKGYAGAMTALSNSTLLRISQLTASLK